MKFLRTDKLEFQKESVFQKEFGQLISAVDLKKQNKSLSEEQNREKDKEKLNNEMDTENNNNNKNDDQEKNQSSTESDNEVNEDNEKNEKIGEEDYDQLKIKCKTKKAKEKEVNRLHEILAPHFLRRLKKDVLQDLPPKVSTKVLYHFYFKIYNISGLI